MTTAYVKELSTGKILTSTNGQDENNPIHIKAINNFVTSRGWNTADYEVGFDTEEAVKNMLESAVTPFEKWKEDIAESDGAMPRYLEDHIKDDHDGIAGNEFLQGKYDEKKLLRATKP